MLNVKRNPDSVSHDHQQTISTQDDLFDLGELECQDLATRQDQTARRDGKLPAEAGPRGLTGPRLPPIQGRRRSNGDQPFVMVQERGKTLVRL